MKDNKQRKYNVLGYIMHGLTGCAVVMSMYMSVYYAQETVMAQSFVKLASLKWIGYAILFQLIALQCKKE